MIRFQTRACAVIPLLLVGLAPARADNPDANQTLQRFLAVWSGGPKIDAGAVEALYADRVIYYGAPRNRRQILREKQAVARRLPHRTYSIVPGTAAGQCDPSGQHCTMTGVLTWSGSGARGGATVRLDLARMGADYKIVAESGDVIARRRCHDGRCAYALPPLRTRPAR
jgi:hypothetical protein